LAFGKGIAFIVWRSGWIGFDDMAGKYQNLKEHIYTWNGVQLIAYCRHYNICFDKLKAPDFRLVMLTQRLVMTAQSASR
jgi:hypothetical protein